MLFDIIYIDYSFIDSFNQAGTGLSGSGTRALGVLLKLFTRP